MNTVEGAILFIYAPCCSKVREEFGMGIGLESLYRLIALNKKDGGVRPIAVGCTLRRLAAKCAGTSIVGAMRDLLVPLQLGYGGPKRG